jgi:hypothetical protein
MAKNGFLRDLKFFLQKTVLWEKFLGALLDAKNMHLF